MKLSEGVGEGEGEGEVQHSRPTGVVRAGRH